MAGIAIEIETKAGRVVPLLQGRGIEVGEVVRAVHDHTIDVGLARLAVPGLDRASLEPILVYCAEIACEKDGATCAGCRRRSEAEGVASLDDLARRHARITIGDGAVAIIGPGTECATAASLDELARTWSGESLWFWARRVIRKLRHGIRRAEQTGTAFAGEGESPAILLMEPQLAENIGMVARAMANTGLDALRLIAPRDGWPNDKARIAASGANHVIDEAARYDDLASAMSDLNWVAATTARQRDLRKPVLTPEMAVAEIRARLATGQRCGILFGRERNGLETSEVAVCDAIVMIPVNPRFASLNLAQAVLILGYEWMRSDRAASLGRITTYESPLSPGLDLRSTRPAAKEEILGLFHHLESELDRLGYFNPPEKREAMVRNIRTMLTRMEPTEQEVRTLRGIIAALAQGKGRGRKTP